MSKSKLSSQAQGKAKTRLVQAHKEEYQAYYKEEYLKLSQTAESQPVSEGESNATV